MRHRAASISLALAVCFAGRAAIAGDDPASGATRASKTAKIAAEFPDPSERAAYTFEGDLYVGEVPSGHAKFAAAPAVVDGRRVWLASEEASMRIDALKLTHHVVATLGKDGALRSAMASQEKDGAESDHVSVERTETGLRVSSKTGAADPEVVELKTDALVFCPLASVLLFLRQAPAEPATYEFESFEASEAALKHATLEVKGPGTWTKGEKPVATWWAVAHLGDRDLEIHLSPERELLVVSTPSVGLVIAKAGLMKVAARPAAKPAASAKEAAMRFTIGSNVGDVEMAASSIHVPTLYAEAKKAGVQMSESDYRADLISRIRSSMKRMPIEEVEPIVKAAAETATETPVGDAVRFVFGEPLHTLAFVVRKFDDGWYIVKLPGS